MDDSKTMANVWPEVKRVFEALSYGKCSTVLLLVCRPSSRYSNL